MNKNTTTMIAKTTYHSEEPLPENNAVVPVEDRLDFGDGTSFIFRFMPVNNGEYWEVHLLNQLDYKGLPEDNHATHRSRSSITKSSFLIDFWCPPEKVNTLNKAKEYAQDWANRTYKYIHWGERF